MVAGEAGKAFAAKMVPHPWMIPASEICTDLPTIELGDASDTDSRGRFEMTAAILPDGSDDPIVSTIPPLVL